MNLVWQQFVILVWKHWLIKSRHKISTFFELIFPFLLSFLLVTISAKLNVSDEPNQDHNINYHPPQIFPPTWKFDFPPFFTFLTAPETNLTFTIIDEIKNSISQLFGSNALELFTFKSYSNEQSLIDDYFSFYLNQSKYNFTFGVVFEKNDNFTFRYKIRSQIFTPISQPYPFKIKPGPWEPQPYKLFSLIQLLVNEAFLRTNCSKKGSNSNNIIAQAFPFPGYTAKPNDVINFLPHIIRYGFMVFYAVIVKRLVEEKYNRSRDMFKVIGLSDLIYWTSTFLNYFIIFSLQALILTISYITKWNGQTSLITYTQFSFLYFILLIYGAASILSAMALSIPFNKPVMAVVVAVIFWHFQLIPLYFLSLKINPSLNIEATQGWRIVSCLLPNMALRFIFEILDEQENYGLGANWLNFLNFNPQYGSLSYGIILLMMLISSFICIFLLWYLDAVWPWQFGVSKPFYFIFLPSYWFSSKYNVSFGSTDGLNRLEENCYFEPDISVYNAGILIKNISKEFGSGSSRKLAVENFSLEIAKHHITILLGQNGAGKSTIMNMVTGMITPTSGSIYVNGHDMITETKQARKSLSFCPQYNSLYDELTVEEHLKLYAAIKGVPYCELNNEIKKTSSEIMLEGVCKRLASQLSGGMKRKLSLGMAIIGETQNIILDEPTSGLDPESRRAIWDILLSLRKHRTIFLTTHFMEEADALADFIAIIGDGKLLCYGSPMFLKKKFSAGYKLRIVKDANCDVLTLNSFISQFFEASELVNEIESELIYSLSNLSESDQINSQLACFFDKLDENKQKLKIISWGLTVTSLENVFLKVGALSDFKNLNQISDEYEIEKDVKTLNSNASQLLFEPISRDRDEGFYLLFKWVKALLLKRFHYSKRYWPMILFQALIPSAIFCATLFIDNYLKNLFKISTFIEIKSKSIYKNIFGFFKSNDFILMNLGHQIYASIASAHDISVFFLNQSTDINEYLINQTHVMTFNDYTHKFLIGHEFNEENNQRSYQIWYNNEAIHSLPISINLMYEVLFKEFQNQSNLKLETINQPFPNDYDLMFAYSMAMIRRAMFSLLLPISISFVAGSYVIFPLYERSTKSKLLQLMTGLNPIVYWICNFIFDCFTHFLTCCLILVVIFYSDMNKVFTINSSSLVGTGLLLFIFGIVAIPIAYFCSFFGKSYTSGFVLLVTFYFIFGTVMMLVDTILFVLINVLISQTFYDTYVLIMNFFPLYSMSKSLEKIYNTNMQVETCQTINLEYCQFYPKKFEKCCQDLNSSHIQNWDHIWVFGDVGIYQELIILMTECLIFLMIVCAFDSLYKKYGSIIVKKLNRFPFFDNSSEIIPNFFPEDAIESDFEDSNVINEKLKVADLLTQSQTYHGLLVDRLTKRYKKFVAVNNLTFCIDDHECFGLLGANGAGKTTFFQILVGDLFPTTGNAYFNQADLNNSLPQFQSQIGYCPQSDALIDILTGTEMLFLFARLRGLSEKEILKQVNTLTEMVGLTKYANKTVKTYSGGNKRKLSLALALIGLPRLLILDEPTSGIDPLSRRKILQALSYIKETKESIIIMTSHSMEECETFCTRLAIMVNGKFKCNGSLQYLKCKFSQGYRLYIKLKASNISNQYVDKVQQAIKLAFPNFALKDYHTTTMEYHLKDTSLKWSYLFKTMNEIKLKWDLEDYIISDTSLEQIFLMFAKQQMAHL